MVQSSFVVYRVIPLAQKKVTNPMATIREVMDAQFADVSFDTNLCHRIIRYSQNFMTRNDDHSAFFGGYLMGVNPIRFFESDRELWYEEVLRIDETLLSEAFKTIGSINQSFNVSSDEFNYTPAYVVHRLLKENSINKELRQDAMKHAFMVLHYRFLTSLLYNRFRTLADPQVVQAAYNSLQLKSDLRRYGSWRKLLEARSEGLVTSPTYREVLRTFQPDSMVIRVVTDTQGRIREVVKKLYVVYLNTLKSGNRVKSISATVMTTDGEQILRDRSSGYASYLRYIQQVVPNERSLIREELIEVIAQAVHTMPPQLLRDCLQQLSRQYRKPHQGYLEDLVREDVLYMFDYLQKNRLLLARAQNLPELLSRLKALLMASRSVDPAVLELRDMTDKLVRNSVTTKNAAVVASVRTGILLYITLRTLTKNYYS